MDRRTEETFSQRGYVDSQQAHEKMAQYHEGNTNKNHNELSLHTSKGDLILHQKEYKKCR